MTLPDFFFEKKLWKKGYKSVAGVDEVGRGSFAGPVVAAAVAFVPNSNFQLPIFNQFSKQIIINDSKQLTPRQRERAVEWIRKNAATWGVGQASVAQINRLGIKKASEIAFRRAIHAISQYHNIDFLLIDAFYIPYVAGLRRKNQKAIIRGDTKSISIAAASIVAKVYRDRLMVKLGRKYGKYNWKENKGYGTLGHRKAIKKFGITKFHRKLFIRNCVSSQAR